MRPIRRWPRSKRRASYWGCAIGGFMRLGDFIEANTEAILVEWETFARSIQPGAEMDKPALRDHAEQILRATARDMSSDQTATEQSDKSKGESEAGADSFRV